MVRSQAELVTLRISRVEKTRLLMALLVSLAVHLGAWGGYQAEKKFGWWQKIHWPVKKPVLQQPKPVAQVIDPMIFLDVTQPAAEPPKQAKYYSDKNSRAANPDSDLDLNQPKLTGQQREIPKTEDATRPVKAQTAQPQPSVEVSRPETQPQTAQNPGTLQPGKPQETKTPEKQTAERPRTVREALAQKPSQMPGLQMQQEGGVRRQSLSSSLDAMATPFGAYDRAIVEAISQRWYDLLDQQKFALNRTGKVAVYFHLNSDGTITDLKIVDSSVGELLAYLCRNAIEQAAPFGKWPSDMRRMVGANFREITFTFYYY